MCIGVSILQHLTLYQYDIRNAFSNASLCIKQFLEDDENYPWKNKGMSNVIDKLLYEKKGFIKKKVEHRTESLLY